MAVEGGVKCVKYLMFFFNLIFLIMGLALAITGIVIASQFSHYVTMLGHGYNLAPILITVLGFIIALVAFFGCFGAMRENRCLIKFFAIFLILLLIIEVIVVILAFVKRNEMEDFVDTVLGDVVRNYNDSQPYHDFLDQTQRTLHCCGAENYTDYYTMKVYADRRVPTSCCITEDHTCTTTYTLPPFILPIAHDFYEEGCKERIVNELRPKLAIVGTIALVVCFIELLGIIFAFCLVRNIEHYEMV